jgi:hypothetical protein
MRALICLPQCIPALLLAVVPACGSRPPDVAAIGSYSPALSVQSRCTSPGGTNSVSNHGLSSYALQNPKIYNIWWGPVQDTGTMDSYLQWLASNAFFRSFGEYGFFGAQAMAGFASGQPAPASAIVDSDIQNFLLQVVANKNLPKDNTVLYNIWLPPNTKVTDNSNACAYHSFISQTRTGALFPLAYTVMFDLTQFGAGCGADAVGDDSARESALSHELAEAFTDPYESGWYQGTPDNGEIGDLCNQMAVSPDGVHLVQCTWSNQANTCVDPTCGSHGDCSSCVNAGCGWCGGVCSPNTYPDYQCGSWGDVYPGHNACGQNSPNCAGHNDCSSCVNAGCGWCGGVCSATTSADYQCGSWGDVYPGHNACGQNSPNCAGHNDCSSCVNAGCGWCGGVCSATTSPDYQCGSWGDVYPGHNACGQNSPNCAGHNDCSSCVNAGCGWCGGVCSATTSPDYQCGSWGDVYPGHNACGQNSPNCAGHNDCSSCVNAGCGWCGGVCSATTSADYQCGSWGDVYPGHNACGQNSPNCAGHNDCTSCVNAGCGWCAGGCSAATYNDSACGSWGDVYPGHNRCG